MRQRELDDLTALSWVKTDYGTMDKLGPFWVVRDGKVKISGKWAFYWYAQYGVPPEIFAGWVEDHLREKYG